MAQEASASATKAVAKFEGDLESRLSEAEKAQLTRWKWLNRLTSLWAPVTVFGISFVIYLFIVEFHTPSYAWAQPALKLFGLVLLAWFVGLIVARNALRTFSRVRKLRHQSWELLGEVAPVVDKHRDRLPPRSFEELAAHCTDLLKAIALGNPAVLEDQLRKTTASADKHLAAWRKQSAIDFGMGFVKAFAIAMIIRTVLIEPFRIPSGSMIPTLEIGDQIFVNKFIYGVRIPFMNKVPFVIVREPQRGDVIVFNNPVDESKDYIKRVIGLPGDTVELIDGVVYINGQAQQREKIANEYVYYDDTDSGGWRPYEISLWRETIDGRAHRIGQRLSGPGFRHEGPWTVPAAHVFVLGDNRDNSSDSRYGLGVTHQIEFVPFGNIKGKAMVIWLAWGYGGIGQKYFKGSGLKTERFFLPVR